MAMEAAVLKIGIISDTHGRHARLQAALELLTAGGVQVLVHCGDVGDTACVEQMAATGRPVYLVAGNVDRDVESLAAACRAVGARFHSEVIEVLIGKGRYLAVTHGDDHRTLNDLIRGEQFPYVCHGHTHVRRDERIGPVRVINPGALHNVSQPSVAWLDTDTDELEFLEVR